MLWGLVAARHGAGVAFLRGKIAGLIARRSGKQSTGGASQDLRAIFEASEREILAVQRETGFDGYWRAYFWLARP